MSSFNFIQDLLIENSKLRLENNKMVQEFDTIKSMLTKIQQDISDIKNSPKIVERVITTQDNISLPIQNNNFASENRPSLFIPTPDMDGLKDSISKVSKKKKKVNFTDAVNRLKDIEDKPEQNK